MKTIRYVTKTVVVMEQLFIAKVKSSKLPIPE